MICSRFFGSSLKVVQSSGDFLFPTVKYFTISTLFLVLLQDLAFKGILMNFLEMKEAISGHSYALLQSCYLLQCMIFEFIFQKMVVFNQMNLNPNLLLCLEDKN